MRAFASIANPFARILRFNDLFHISSSKFSEPRLTTSGIEKGLVMMSANCSVVVTLSRFSRPCRVRVAVQSAGSQRVLIDQVPNVLPCQCTQMRLPSDKQSWCHKQLPGKTHFHHCSELLVSVFETNEPRTLHQASTSSRPPFFVEVCPRSITPANQFVRTNSRCMSRVP